VLVDIMRLVINNIGNKYDVNKSKEYCNPLSTILLRLVYVQLMLLIADILVIRCTVNYFECVENRLIILPTLEEVGYFKNPCGIFPDTVRSFTQHVNVL
jgi:hypothetical protein